MSEHPPCLNTYKSKDKSMLTYKTVVKTTVDFPSTKTVK